MIFNKTTNFAFKKYGDSYQNTVNVVPDDYISTNQCISNKFFNETYCFDYDIYVRCSSGYSMVVIYDIKKEKYVEYALHRVCKISKGIKFNIISLTSFSNIVLYTKENLKDYLKPSEEYHYQEVVNRINVTKIIGCYNDFRTKGYNFKGEHLQCFEFTYVFSGKIYITYEGKEIVVGKDQLIIFAPGDLHTKLINEKACSYLTIIFEMDIDENSKNLITRKVFNVPLARDLNLNFLSQKTRNLYDNSLMITATQYIVVYLLKGLHVQNHLSDYENDSNIVSNDIIDEIRSYISTDYKNILSVEDICEKFFFSRSSIQKLFNNQLGISPKKYIVKFKIDKAVEILKSENIPINEVTKLVGFNDQHYFSRAFKKETGMSPTEFKKEIELHHI